MNTQIWIRRTVFAAAIAYAASVPFAMAQAQTFVPPAMQVQAQALAKVCEGDFRQHCPGVQPGGGRILACL
ncbi:MAG: cysteine rich repeat-containing protein [Pseudorhodoplanes sp.]